MPAINPERLKHETAELVKYFSEPDKFVHSLVDLLDRYADRIRRPSHVGAPPPLIRAFQVATPVLRQIVVTLTPLVESEPEQALAIVDTLWEKPYLETRLLAARLLGLIPAKDPDLILARIKAWATPKEEELLLNEIFDKGLAVNYLQNSNSLLEMVRDWMGSSQIELQILGAKALFSLAHNPNFDNLPFIYRLLLPLVLESDLVLRPHLVSIIRVLAERSPQETAHFLHQVVIVADKPGTSWIARQALDLFPEETQERIKEAMRDR